MPIIPFVGFTLLLSIGILFAVYCFHRVFVRPPSYRFVRPRHWRKRSYRRW